MPGSEGAEGGQGAEKSTEWQKGGARFTKYDHIPSHRSQKAEC